MNDINFITCSFDPPDGYKAFILRHEHAEKTEKAAWMAAAKTGKAVIPYCEYSPREAPERDSIIYFEFVDEDLNIYVDFFNRDTQEHIESYKFFDEVLAWTIGVDNAFYGDPLGIMTRKKANP